MNLGGVTTRSIGAVYLYLHSQFKDLASDVLCLGLQSLHQPHTVRTKHQVMEKFQTGNTTHKKQLKTFRTLT